MVRVDDRRERRSIGFLAQMPSVNPGELRLRHALRGMGHPFETEIRAVGENGGEQGVFVLGWLAGTQIGEGIRKAGAAADFVQKLGDPNSRAQPVESSVETLGFRRRDRLGRRYMKDAVAKDDALQAPMA